MKGFPKQGKGREIFCWHCLCVAVNFTPSRSLMFRSVSAKVSWWNRTAKLGPNKWSQWYFHKILTDFQQVIFLTFHFSISWLSDFHCFAIALEHWSGFFKWLCIIYIHCYLVLGRDNSGSKLEWWIFVLNSPIDMSQSHRAWYDIGSRITHKNRYPPPTSDFVAKTGNPPPSGGLWMWKLHPHPPIFTYFHRFCVWN